MANPLKFAGRALLAGRPLTEPPKNASRPIRVTPLHALCPPAGGTPCPGAAARRVPKGFALARSYPIALVLLFAAGFFELSCSSMTQTLVQLNAPDASRGRVLGLYNMAAAGLRAFSGLTVGLAGSLVSIHFSLALSAGLYAAAVGMLRLGSANETEAAS